MNKSFGHARFISPNSRLDFKKLMVSAEMPIGGISRGYMYAIWVYSYFKNMYMSSYPGSFRELQFPFDQGVSGKVYDIFPG